MLYYKVPIVDGRVDCSAGSILCRAYPQDTYMVCKFESVAEVGADWVEITEAEFDENCPDFPLPETPPVQEVIATSAALEEGSVVLTLPDTVSTGTLVKFSAPCDCSAVTGGIAIGGVTYTVVDAMANSVTGKGGAWCNGAQVSVLLDCEAQKAYIINAGAVYHADRHKKGGMDEITPEDIGAVSLETFNTALGEVDSALAEMDEVVG